MKLIAFILVATFFKSIPAASVAKDQVKHVETFQCNKDDDDKQFDRCEFSHENHKCVVTIEKENEDCTEDYLKQFTVEQSDEGCKLTIQDLKPNLFGTWTCKLYEDTSETEIDYGDDSTIVIFEKKFQLQDNQAGALLGQSDISTIVWVVLLCVVVIGVFLFFVLKKKVWNQ